MNNLIVNNVLSLYRSLDFGKSHHHPRKCLFFILIFCLSSSLLNTGVLQATTGEQFEKRYSPNFKIDESLRRQSSTKRKRDEVLR